MSAHPFWRSVAYILFLLVALPFASAAETKPATEPLKPPSRKSSSVESNADPFDAFRVIAERNIFNPNRSPRISRGVSSEPSAGPSDEVISLVGTMQYEKGPFAFFDGSDSKYRKAAPEGGRVATFVVKHVTAQTIDLTDADRTITLRVGEQLRRRPGGEWTVVTSPPPLPSVAATTASIDSTSSRPAPAIPANASEVFKRLAERRKKELEK